MLGFDPSGPVPRFEEFFQNIHPDDQAASRERFEKAIRDKADFELDYRIVHPDKGVRDIHVEAVRSSTDSAICMNSSAR